MYIEYIKYTVSNTYWVSITFEVLAKHKDDFVIGICDDFGVVTELSASEALMLHWKSGVIYGLDFENSRVVIFNDVVRSLMSLVKNVAANRISIFRYMLNVNNYYSMAGVMSNDVIYSGDKNFYIDLLYVIFSNRDAVHGNKVVIMYDDPSSRKFIISGKVMDIDKFRSFESKVRMLYNSFDDIGIPMRARF